MASKPEYEGGQPNNVHPIGITDHEGNPYFRGIKDANNSTGGGGGGRQTDMNTRLDRLEQHRTGLWTAMGVAFAVMGGGFLFLLGQIDGRFDRVDEPLKVVRETVAGQSAALVSVKESLVRIEEKVEDDNEPERSPATEEIE